MPRLQDTDLAEATSSVNQKEKVSVEVWDGSAPINESLRYVTYLYVEHVSSALTNNVLYTEHTNGENWVIYELQGVKLPRVYELVQNTVAAALGIMTPGSLTALAVKLEEQGQVLHGRHHSETLVFRS